MSKYHRILHEHVSACEALLKIDNLRDEEKAAMQTMLGRIAENLRVTEIDGTPQ